MNRKIAIDTLKKTRRLRSIDEVHSFEQAVEYLYGMGDPTVIPDLLTGFDDSTQQHEVMWGLVHAVESVNQEAYMRALIEAVPNMLETAREWLMILHYRLLNNPTALSAYKSMLRTSSTEAKNGLIELFGAIAVAEPKYAEQVSVLLRELYS